MKKKFLVSIVSAVCAVTCAFGFAACGGHDSHDYAEKYTYNSEYHWRQCSGCKDKFDYSKHSEGGDVCTVCGYKFDQGTTGDEGGDSAFGNVAVSANGVLSWNKIKGASKYVLKVTYAAESDQTEYDIDKSQTSANLNELRNEGFPVGKSSVEIVAYENVKVTIGGQTEYQEVPMTDVKQSFRIVKSNGNFSLVRLSYADTNIKLDGFYAEKQTVEDKSVYLYEQVLKDNQPMILKINNIVKAANGHTVQFYKSESGRNAGDTADVWNSFELQMGYPQVQHGANFYYVRVTDNGTGDTHDYDLCVYGIYSVAIQRYDTSFYEDSDGLRTYTHTPIGNALKFNEMDIIPQEVLYNGVGNDRLGRSSNYEIVEKQDMTLLANSTEINYYFYDEETVRYDCSEYDEWSKTYYLTEVSGGWRIACKQSVIGIVNLPNAIIGSKVVAADYSYCKIVGLAVGEGATTLTATFAQCWDLLDVFLPSTITEMPKNSFAGVNTEVTVHCAFTSEKANDFTLYWNYGENKRVKTEYDVAIPDGAFIDALAISNGLVLATMDGSDNELRVSAVLSGFDGIIPATVTVGEKTYNVTRIDALGDMQSFTIGENIKEIADGALLGVQNVTVVSGSRYFTVKDKLLYSKDYTRLLRIANKNVDTDVTSLTVDARVQAIDFGALAEYTSLQSLTIPFVGAAADATENTHLGYIFGAREWRDNRSSVPATLQSVTVESGKAISDYAFFNCNSLTDVTLPDSVTSIGRDAFYGCSGLANIIIPNGVTVVGMRAFDNTAWYDGQTDGIVYVGKVAYKYKGAISDNGSVILNAGIVSVSDYAFQNCTGLTGITIPDSVTHIGDGAFAGCTGLTGITIPNSVTHIGDSAFAGCTGLTGITIPNSVTYIGGGAFNGCIGLISVTVPFVGSSTTAAKPFFYFFGGNGNGSVPSSLKNVTITGNSTIVRDAFFQCTGLISVTISGNTVIDGFAFNRCTGLTSVTIGNGVTYIGESAFCYCDQLTDITFNGTKAQWNAIDKFTDGNGFPWDHGTGNYTVHCTDGDIEKFNQIK